jgi:signal transduction histidine kinase
MSWRRWLQRPGALGAVLVGATLVLATALAYQAFQAAASHRVAVETALEHHASTAAWRFAREARGWVGWGMNEAADKLQREVGEKPKLPGPEAIQKVLAEKYCDCMTAAFGRTFFSVVVDKKAALQLGGEPLSQRATDDLRAQMLVFANDTAQRQDARRWRILQPGTPRLNRATDVAFLWRVGKDGQRARAVYGMVVERYMIERPLIGAQENGQFFPPKVAGGAKAKDLVRLEVAGPNGVPLFARGPETHRYSGTDTLGSAYGDMVAMAAINPDAAELLVAGGLPPSRVPMIIGLFLLSLAMGGGGVLLRRREHRLASLREDFVSGVSHELRTPLTQIRMLSELLETDGFKSPSERSRAIEIIHRESLRLTNLVDNVLEFTRLRRTAPAGAAERVSIGDVLREVAESFTPLLEAQGNRIEVDAAHGLEILGDRDALSRVLRNLVENAAKYGPASQTIRMSLTRADQNGTARVTVDDEGPGIPPSERERIWQPYYRLDRDRNAPAGGSGLGLSVVADLVRMLGGSVSVGDAPGKGARFTVDLPIAT